MARPPLLPLLLLQLVVWTAATPELPAARPGLLARTMDLLGWGSPANTDPHPPSAQNATAVVERFRDRLLISVAQRLKAVRSVHRSATRRQHHRAKRSHPVRMLLDRDEHGVDVLLSDHGVETVWRIPAPGAQHVHMFKDDGKTYALAAFGRGSTTSWLYELVGGKWTARSNFSSFGTVQFTSFEHDGQRYVIGAEFDCFANRADKRGSVLYRLSGGQLQYQHVLPVGYPTDVSIWTDYDTFHIGVTSEFEKAAGGTTNYHVNSSIFKWSDGNFQQHSLPTYGAKDIEHFRMQSHSFLAVANYQNNDGSLNLYSEILRYSLESGQYRPYQRLMTHGAVRFRHFSWGTGVAAEHFLVVANQADRDAGAEETNYRVNSVVYKFSHSQFVPFQCIPTVRVRDVLPVWGPAGEFVLALVDDEGLKLYQYTGWRFVLVTLVLLPAAGAGAGAANVGLSAFTHDGYGHLTVGSTGGSDDLPFAYRLRFRRRRDLHELHTNCTTWCQKLHGQLEAVQPRVDSLQTLLETAPRVDQTVTFASLKINSVQHSFFHTVAVNNVRLQQNVTLNSGLLERLRSLRHRLQLTLATLTGLHNQLAHTVSVTANHTFSQGVTLTGSWHLNTASVRSLQLRSLNGLTDVPSFLSGLVWTDRPFGDESARLAFRSLALRNGASLYANTLSHVRPASFVTLSGDHVITASKVIHGDVTAADISVMLVNGVRITPDTVLVQGQLPAGAVQFGTLTVTNLRVHSINGIAVRTVLEQAVTASSGRLPDSVVFAGPVVIRSASVRSINGVSVERLLQHALTTTGGQTVTGAWTVARLHVDGDLKVTGTVNGLHVPEDLVLVNRPELSYSLSSVSVSSVTIQRLTVTDSLGPVQVSDRKLQLLLTAGDQLIVGKKTLGSLHLSANSSVSGLINGVNVSAAVMESALDQSTTAIDGNKVIQGDVIFLSDLRLTGLLNGVDVSGLLQSALKLSDTSLPSMVFSDLVISGDLRTSQLNGLSPSEWVMAGGVDQIITGNKALLSLTAAGITVDLLNGLQLDDFYRSVLRTEGDQHVLGSLLFVAETALGKVTAGSVLWEGYDLAEAVTVSGSHVISGSKMYSAPLQVADLQLTDLWVDGLVDGVNLTSLLSGSAAANTTYLTVTGSQRFTSRVTATTLVVSGQVNGEQLLTLLQNTVRDGIVRGDLVFDAPVTVDSLQFTGSFDGVTSEEFGSDWLTSAGGQTLSGPLRLTGTAPLSVHALGVLPAAVLNDVPGHRLLDGLVRLGPGTVINQNVTLAWLAAAAVTVQLSGVNFTDAMRQNQSQIILGSKVFLGGVYSLDTLKVAGAVNGVHLSDVCGRVVLTDTANTITRLTVNGDVTLHHVLSPLSWTLNGVPLSQLDSLVWLSGARQTLTGHISLAQPTFTSIEVQTLLSGVPAVPVDLLTYLQHYWSVSRPQTVTGAATFLSDVTVTQLTADSLTVTGRVNGKQLSTLLSYALTAAGGTVTGHWTLPDLVITGPLSFASLNGVPASSLLRTTATEAHFTTRQTVRQLTVDGNVVLPPGGRLYQLDVSRDLDTANFLTRRPGAFVVSSDVVFGSQMVTFTRPLTMHGPVNGVRLRRAALLTLSGEQWVAGVTRLSHVGGRCLSVPDLVTPHINRVNLHRLLHSAVRLHGGSSGRGAPLSITGHWTFDHGPAVLGYQVNSSDSQNQMEQLLRQVLSALRRLRSVDETTGRQHVTAVRDIYRALQEARAQLQVASYLQYYVEVQRWQSDIVRLLPVFLDGDDSVPTFLLAIWETRVQILRWQPHRSFGQWIDGARYPESQVACMAGLRRADGTAHIAEARLTEPPAGVQDVPDRVYRWDDPALRRLGGAVNYIFVYYRDALTQSQAMPSHKTVDVKSLKPSPAHDCFLFVHFAGNVSHLVCYRDAVYGFAVHQAIETQRARQASVYSASDSVCVAVAGGGGVDLWCWDAGRAQLTRRQTIAAAAAAGVHTATFHGHVLMAVTRGDTPKMAGMVDIYRLEPSVDKFSHVQTVPVWAVRSARLLVLPSDELVLACLTADGRVEYLQYRGTAGFEPRGQLRVGHAVTIEVFNMPGLATQMTVAGRPRPDMFALNTHYPAAAFAGKFMGHEW